MSWLFSQALVEEYSQVSCSDGEQSAQLSVMPTPQLFWRNDKMTDFSIFFRFGLTSQLLTADHGAELLMSFLVGFPVRISARREKAQACPESEADSGLKWQGSFAKYDPGLSLWKTHQFSLLGGLESYSETWPRWGSMRNGECWERPTWERRTKGTEYGYWPTPTKSDGTGGPGSSGRQGGENLRTAVKTRLWPTPTVCGNNQAPKAGTTRGTGLATAVRTWPTPCAADSMRSGRGDLYAKIHNIGRQREFPTPRATCRDMGTLMMSRFSGTDRKSGKDEAQYNPKNGGPLNPPWVAWLMGWPINWTRLKPLETDRYQQPWQKRTNAY